MSTTGSVYNFNRVKQLTSPHQDTHTHICHQDSLLQPSPQPPMVHLKRALNHRLVVSLFPQTSQISVLPHTCLQQTCVSKLPQNHPKRSSPNSVHQIHLKAAQVLPCGATWLLEGARPLRLFLRTTKLFLLSLSSKYFLPWLCTLVLL
jgi:hypothetical protein